MVVDIYSLITLCILKFVFFFWAYLYKCGESGARHHMWLVSRSQTLTVWLRDSGITSLCERFFTFVSARGGWVWQVGVGARNLRHSLTRMQLRSQTVRSP